MLTLKDLEKYISKTKEKLMKQYKFTPEEVEDMPIYLGDDDDLNGIHNSSCMRIVDINEDEEWLDPILGGEVDDVINNKYILIQ